MKIQQFRIRHKSFRWQLTHITYELCQGFALAAALVGEALHQLVIQSDGGQVVPGTDLILEDCNHLKRKIAVVPSLEIQPTNRPYKVKRSISKRRYHRNDPLLALGVKEIDQQK